VAQCVTIDGSGNLLADPAPVESCTGFVLVTPSEFTMMQGVLVPLSVDEGAVIGISIVTAWAIAFGFRMLGQLVADADA